MTWAVGADPCAVRKMPHVLPRIQHLERRRPSTLAESPAIPRPARRHGPCLVGEHMSLSARFRSWMVLPIVAVLMGTPALPLALCAFTGNPVPCAADMTRQVGSHHQCDESGTPPPATMTCCCDRDAGTLPLTMTRLTEVAGAPLAIAISPVDPVTPDGVVRGGIESTALLTRHRPLFQLFSTFLI